MVAPSLKHTWAGVRRYALNDTTTVGRFSTSIVYALKDMLTSSNASGGTSFHTSSGARDKFWTVEQSCDAVSVSSSDLWVPARLPEFQSGFAGSPHFWVVLKYVGPSHTLRVCLTTNNGSYPEQWGYFASIDAPFTGGTTTQRPTAANEICARLNSVPGLSSSTYAMYSLNFSYTYVASLTMSMNDGQFHFFVSRDNSGSLTHNVFYLGAVIPEDKDDDDVNPLCLLCAGGDATTVNLPMPNPDNNTYSIGGEVGCVARWYTSGTTLVPFYGGLSGNNMGRFLINTELNFRDKLLAGTSDLLALPISIVHSDTTNIKYRGYVPDVYHCNTETNDNILMTKWRSMGAFAFPFGA